MMDISDLKELRESLKCNLNGCERLITDPVLLPCCLRCVCQHHIVTNNNRKNLDCSLCKQKHVNVQVPDETETETPTPYLKRFRKVVEVVVKMDVQRTRALNLITELRDDQEERVEEWRESLLRAVISDTELNRIESEICNRLRQKSSSVKKEKDSGLKSKNNNLLLGSEILNRKQAFELASSQYKATPYDFNLVYRGSRDGFDASAFHTKCDFVGATLTIIRAKHTGYIFGGYTRRSWKSKDPKAATFKEDAKAFVFFFLNENGQNKLLKLKSTQPTKAIRCDPNYGPVFGDGDLTVHSGDGWHHPGKAFRPMDCYESQDAKISTYLTQFFVSEIETYQLF